MKARGISRKEWQDDPDSNVYKREARADFGRRLSGVKDITIWNNRINL